MKDKMMNSHAPKTKARKSSLLVSRRTILGWSTPTLTAITLPIHAQTSPAPMPTICSSAPVMTASVPSKCSGMPAVGQAVLSINSGVASEAFEITAITISGSSTSDVITLPTLPAQVSSATAIDITWTGNASDATTCLPLSTIMFQVVYSCVGNNTISMVNFNLTEILADAIP